MVLGDRGVLARTLVNLLGNAVKYGPEGSTITGRAGRAALGAAAANVDLSIADQGPGLTRGGGHRLPAVPAVRAARRTTSPPTARAWAWPSSRPPSPATAAR
jgi:hypothetical protein